MKEDGTICVVETSRRTESTPSPFRLASDTFSPAFGLGEKHHLRY